MATTMVKQGAICEHMTQEVRLRIVANGVTHAVRQCLTCGRQLRAIPMQQALEETKGKQIAPFNKQLQVAVQRRRAAYEAWLE